MELDKLNKWLTLLANVGVVAGIVFLGVELNQNQTILEQNQRISILSARAEYVQEIQTFRKMIIQDEDVARIWTDGMKGEELTSLEERRFSSLCTYQLWADASMYEKAIVFGKIEQATAVADFNRQQIDNSPRLELCWEENKKELADFGYGAMVNEIDAGR